MTPAQLKQARKEAGFTQTQLAQKIGVTQATISYWESGIHKPSKAELMLLKTILV